MSDARDDLNAKREMTLQEWVDRLPDGHRIRKDLAELRRQADGPPDAPAERPTPISAENAMKALDGHLRQMGQLAAERDEMKAMLYVNFVQRTTMGLRLEDADRTGPQLLLAVLQGLNDRHGDAPKKGPATIEDYDATRKDGP